MSLLEERISKIHEFADKGYDTAKMADEMGLTIRTIKYYANLCGIKIQRKSKYKRNPEISKINEEIVLFSIDAPYNGVTTLEEIGKTFHLTKERARQILEDYGINFKDLKREKKKREKQKYQELSYVLKQYTLKKAEEEKGLLYRKAIERNLDMKKTWNLLDPEKIFNLLKVYGKAKQKGEKLSLEELSKETGIKSSTFLGKLLKELGLEPMYGARDKPRRLTNEQIEKINLLYKTQLSPFDIGSFMNLPEYIISQRWYRINKDLNAKNTKRGLTKNFYFRKNRTYLTYRLASRTYQDIDENRKYKLGFSLEEIAELNNTIEEAVKYAVEKRKEIEPEIKEVLRILYPGKRIGRPYITARLRK